MDKNILFIVEGIDDEPKLIKKLYEICFPAEYQNYKFYVFDTNIHQLVPMLMPNDEIDEDMDLLLLLRSYETNPDRKEILSKKYSDVFLIFDFDPQNGTIESQKIEKLLTYFSDSTEMGKLYINYPMIESYRHLLSLPDPSFIGRTIDTADALHYKELVDSEAFSELKNLHKHTYEIFVSVTTHHIRQAFKMQGIPEHLLSLDNYDNLSCSDIFRKQADTWKKDGKCVVLNTSLFLLVDYKPREFFYQITRHREKYRI